MLAALGSDPQPVLVAFSGGLDSTVLLHATAAVCRELGVPLSAIHVHHGLQPAALAWPGHCREIAQGLGVPLTIVDLPPAQPAGQGLEAWARRERYAAIAAEARRVGAGRVVVAHHADDQVETVLLRLARGAGLRGLAAMASERPLEGVRLLRPLLALPRSVLVDYARALDLSWVEDPGNADPAHARNRVRHEALPALVGTAPGAKAAIARAATLAADAQAVLDEVAGADLDAARAAARRARAAAPDGIAALLGGVPEAWVLHRSELAALSAARQRLALRAWIEAAGRPMPALAVIEEARRQLLAARAAQGRVALDAVALCRYRDWLWIEPLRPAPELPAQGAVLRWSGQARLPAAAGWLKAEPVPAGYPGALAEAELRAGELRIEALASSLRLRLRPGGASRSLKHWHQAMGVPARLRASLPGIRLDGRLVQVAGLGEVWEREQPGRDPAPSGARAKPASEHDPTDRWWRLWWEPADATDPRHALCALQHKEIGQV